jgi:hypothetical protein
MGRERIGAARFCKGVQTQTSVGTGRNCEMCRRLQIIANYRSRARSREIGGVRNSETVCVLRTVSRSLGTSARSNSLRCGSLALVNLLRRRERDSLAKSSSIHLERSSGSVKFQSCALRRRRSSSEANGLRRFLVRLGPVSLGPPVVLV